MEVKMVRITGNARIRGDQTGEWADTFWWQGQTKKDRGNVEYKSMIQFPFYDSDFMR